MRAVSAPAGGAPAKAVPWPGRRTRPRAGSARRNLAVWALAVPALIFFFIFLWQPLVSTVINSFFAMTGFAPTHFLGLQNYDVTLRDPVARQAVKNGLFYVGWSLLLGIPVPLIMAIVINELRWFSGVFRFAVYLPSLVPVVITSLMWTFVLSASGSGLANRLLAVVGVGPVSWLQDPNITILVIVLTMVWNGFGGTTLLYIARLQGINRELYDAAAIDGAGFLRRVWNITLPQISGLIMLFIVFQVIGAFQILVQPMVMTAGGPNYASLSPLLLSWQAAFQFNDPGESNVISVLTFIILVVLTAGYMRMQRRDVRAARRERHAARRQRRRESRATISQKDKPAQAEAGLRQPAERRNLWPGDHR